MSSESKSRINKLKEHVPAGLVNRFDNIINHSSYLLNRYTLIGMLGLFFALSACSTLSQSTSFRERPEAPSISYTQAYATVQAVHKPDQNGFPSSKLKMLPIDGEINNSCDVVPFPPSPPPDLKQRYNLNLLPDDIVIFNLAVINRYIYVNFLFKRDIPPDAILVIDIRQPDRQVRAVDNNALLYLESPTCVSVHLEPTDRSPDDINKLSEISNEVTFGFKTPTASQAH